MSTIPEKQADEPKLEERSTDKSGNHSDDGNPKQEGRDHDHKIHGNAPNDKSVDTNFQAGVQDVEAITITWTKWALIIAYIGIWCMYFVQGLVSGVSGSLLPYVTSDFAEHSLTPTVGVLSQVIGGVSNFAIAKILDINGRPQGFLLCAFLATIGLAMSAACNTVEAFAASQVFYTVGINGIGYSLSVFIADTSSLRRRGLMQALLTSPYLITSWIVGPIATSFLNGAGWRWAFGMESILLPGVALPLFGIFTYHFLKAKRSGVIPRKEKTRGFGQSVIHYLVEFDVVGLLLISAGFAFFLLPFNLYTQQAKGWGSAIIICFLVFAVVLMAAFTVWEIYFAKVCLIPWAMLKNRTILGACIYSLPLFISITVWQPYFGSFLQVVNDLTVTEASYVSQGAAVASILVGIVTGAIISWTGRYKPITAYFGVPLVMLGLGLMIYFREPTQYAGWQAMCQLFVFIANGIMVITVEIAALAGAAEQQYFAITIALLNLFGYIGTAIGYTLAAAIWQGILPQKLALYLPADAQANLTTIFSDLPTQLSYEWGSPTRMAIQQAYGDTWRYLLIVAVSLWPIGIASLFMWRDIDVKKVKQNKGTVV